MADEHSLPGVRYAASVSTSTCKHGSVFIHLHGEDGEIFAVASMNVTTAVEFSERLTDDCEEAIALVRSGDAEPAPEVH